MIKARVVIDNKLKIPISDLRYIALSFTSIEHIIQITILQKNVQTQALPSTVVNTYHLFFLSFINNRLFYAYLFSQITEKFRVIKKKPDSSEPGFLFYLRVSKRPLAIDKFLKNEFFRFDNHVLYLAPFPGVGNMYKVVGCLNHSGIGKLSIFFFED